VLLIIPCGFLLLKTGLFFIFLIRLILLVGIVIVTAANAESESVPDAKHFFEFFDSHRDICHDAVLPCPTKLAHNLCQQNVFFPFG